LDDLEAVNFAASVNDMLCFHQCGISIIVLEHHLQGWKRFADFECMFMFALR